MEEQTRGLTTDYEFPEVPEYIPMYTARTENRRSKEVVTNTDWNELFNLLLTQGDHTARSLAKLFTYLFGDGTDSGIDLGGLAEDVAEHLEDYANPHRVVANQVNTNVVGTIIPSNVQDVLERLLEDINTRATTAYSDATYETKVNSGTSVEDLQFSPTTGILTILHKNGTTSTINLNLATLITNWDFDDTTQKLVLTKADGTYVYVDLSAFITITEFADTEDIIVVKNNNVVSFTISPTYKATITSALASIAEMQADVTTKHNNVSTMYATVVSDTADVAANTAIASSAAATSTTNATLSGNSAKDSEAWAAGTRGGVDVPATDATYHNNAKYWALVAGQAAGGGVSSFNGRSGAVSPTDADYTGSLVKVTGYSKASSASAIAGTDTVNQALGKLEKKIDDETASNKVTAFNGRTGAVTPSNSDYVGSDIKLTGYTKDPVAVRAIASTDTVNEAFGKLEATVDYAVAYLGSVAQNVSTHTTAISTLNTAVGKIEEVNTFSIATSDWQSNNDPNTVVDYPYVATKTSDKYTSTSTPIWDILGANGIMTEAEEEDANNIRFVDFGINGVTLYAKDVPLNALVLRVKGR